MKRDKFALCVFNETAQGIIDQERKYKACVEGTGRKTHHCIFLMRKPEIYKEIRSNSTIMDKLAWKIMPVLARVIRWLNRLLRKQRK